jgi:hypothetical protein
VLHLRREGVVLGCEHAAQAHEAAAQHVGVQAQVAGESAGRGRCFSLDGGESEILTVGGAEIGRLVFEPGWRWSTDVKPIAGTDSCEAPHFQYHVSGRLAIRMDDGTELVAQPGDITSLPSGHDAWVVGDEPAVVVDWYGASTYANPT